MRVVLDDGRLGQALDAVDLSDVVGAAARGVYTRAVELVPVRTGRLRRSIRITASGSTGRVEATAPYAVAVSYGGPTNPHPVPFLDLAARTPQVVRDVSRAVDRELDGAGL